MEEATLDTLKAKHGRVALIQFREDIEVVLRAPSRAEYKVYRASMHNGGSADATEDLVRKTVVWCTGGGDTDASARAAFDGFLNDYPGLCENRTATKAIADFTGIEFASQGKG